MNIRDLVFSIIFQDRATKELKGANSQVDTFVNGLVDARTQVDKVQSEAITAGKVTEKSFDKATEAVKSTEKAFDSATEAGKTVEKSFGRATIAISETGQEAYTTNGFLSRVGSVGKTAGLAIASSFAVASAAVLKVGTNAEMAFSKLQASTGATTAEMEGLRQSALDVYQKGYGQSLDQVTIDLATVKNTLQGLDDQQRTTFMQGAYAIQDLWGAELTETTRTVDTLTKNFDGLSQTKAMDAISYGFQNGLDKSGELLDTLNEYAPQFSEMGYSIEETMAILKAGSDAGAWSLDKVGDAIKESHLRMSDMSDTTKDAYKELGFNAEEYAGKIAKGGDQGNKAFQDIVTKLQGVKDETKRNELAVALFGTQYEDLREKVIFALADATKSVENFEGATKKAADTAKDNLGSKLNEVWRGIQVGAIEGFSKASEGLTTLTDQVIADMPNMQETISNAAENMTTAVTGVLKGAKEVYDFFNDNWSKIESIVIPITGAVAGYTLAVNASTIATTVATTATKAMTVAQGALNAVMRLSPMGLVAAGIGALIGVGIVLYKNWDTVKAKATELWANMTEKFAGIKDNVSNAMSTLKDNVAQSWDSVKSKASEVWSSISGTWEAMKTGTANAWNTIKSTAVDSLNGIVSKINDLISTINKIPGVNIPIVPKIENPKIPDSVMANASTLASSGLSTKTATLPQLATGGITTGAAIAMIGEGKHQEAVLPLTDNVFRGIGSGIAQSMSNDGTTKTDISKDYSKSVYHTSSNRTMNHSPVFQANITVNGSNLDEEALERTIKRTQEREFYKLIDQYFVRLAAE